MSSLVGWKSGPVLFYHIYCVITSSKMGIGVGCARQRQRLARVGRGRNLVFRVAGLAGSWIAREDAGHAEVWRGNSKTSRERHRDRFLRACHRQALRINGAARRLFPALPHRANLCRASLRHGTQGKPALVACLDLMRDQSGRHSGRRAERWHTESGAGAIGLDVLPRTLCKLRKGMRHPQNLKAVGCLGTRVRHPPLGKLMSSLSPIERELVEDDRSRNNAERLAQNQDSVMPQKSIKCPEKICEKSYSLISEGNTVCGLPPKILTNLVWDSYDLNEDAKGNCQYSYHSN